MSYANGKIPATARVPVAGHPNARLLPGTAAAWAAVRTEVAARFGWTPALTGDLDAYRPYATQEALFRARYSPTPLLGRPTKKWLGRLWWLRPGMATAATPGTSNHGLGITVDVTGLGGFTGTRYGQWSQVARAHGWSNTEGRSIGEAWHWTFTGNPEPISHTIPAGTITDVPTLTPLVPLIPTVQEDDMLNLIIWCYRELVGREPSVDEVQSWIATSSGWTPAQVLAGFTGADAEPVSVVKAFRDYLGREPGPSEVTGWDIPGATIRAVRDGVSKSREALARKA